MLGTESRFPYKRLVPVVNDLSKPSGFALITGGSAGLGEQIAGALVRAGYRVAILGRDPDRVEQSVARLNSLSVKPVPASSAWGLVGDVTDPACVADCFDQIRQRWGRLDLLVNCVGQSDRGRIESLTPERLRSLIDANLIGTLLCSQAALPLLRQHRGVVVNIGSLAGKIGSRYLGGYCAAKHALTGLTQQMRLEWREYGVHVALISPGPIRREDAGQRYTAQSEGLPESAGRPGGGARLKGLPPERVAAEVLRCARRQSVDVILPRRARWLICLMQSFPRWGDRLVLLFTGGGSPGPTGADKNPAIGEPSTSREP